MKKITKKISRGYRLEWDTHKLIKSLQDLTNNDANDVLRRSCNMYLSLIVEKRRSEDNDSVKNEN